jgi:hypothetical protein
MRSFATIASRSREVAVIEAVGRPTCGVIGFSWYVERGHRVRILEGKPG